MNQQYLQSRSHLTEESDPVINPQAIYQTLIRQTSNLYPLCKFKTSKGSNKQLFPDALKYPDFFNYNLVSPGRVIKRLDGQQSVLRGFYYQLMKLAFQIQIEDKDYIQVLKNVIFSPQFMLQENPSSPSSGKNYSDLQYKKIFAEFMQILMNQSIPNLELSILSYPIVDEAIIKILQNLLKFKSSIQIWSCPGIQVLKHLCQLFQVTMVQYGNCCKFQQSDIFLYEHSSRQFYIAFLNEMAEMSDMSQSSNKNVSRNGLSSEKKKIQLQEQDQIQCGFQNQKDIKNYQYMNDQFQIQTPTKQGQRNCSSNVTYNGNRQDIKIDKNYRNTYGFNEIKSQRQSYEFKSSTFSEFIPLEKQTSKQTQQKYKANVIQDSIQTSKSRVNRQSIINGLQKIVSQDMQNEKIQGRYVKSQFNKYTAHIDNYNLETRLSDSKLVSSIIGPTAISKEINGIKPECIKPVYDKSQLKKKIPAYQYKTKSSTKYVALCQNPQQVMLQSTQSDQVIGYSDFPSTKVPPLNDKKFSYSNFPSTQALTVSNKPIGQSDSPCTLAPALNATKQSPSTTTTQPPCISQQPSSSSSSSPFYTPKPVVLKPSYPPPLHRQQTLGTLYRQFTDTKVLQVLPEDVQYNIRRMRRKYKGVHASDYFRYARN